MNNSILINRNILWISIIGVFLVLIAGLRSSEVSKDAMGYISILYNLEHIQTITIEPSFSLIAFIVNYNETYLFLVYAIFAIVIKLIAIKRISIFPLFSIFVYISLYFILFEMTQIRVGVAIGIFLLSIKDIYERNIFNFLVKIAFATFFHYSMLITLFAFFINPKKINKSIYIILPLIAVAISIFSNKLNLIHNILNILISIGPEFLKYKFQLISDNILLEKLGEINIFNFQYLSYIIIYYLLLIKIDLLQMKNKYTILFLKLFAIAIISFYTLSSIPVLAFRISNIFGSVLILLLPMILLIFKDKKMPIIILSLWLLLNFVVYGILGLLKW
jgi:hypothetical protein